MHVELRLRHSLAMKSSGIKIDQEKLLDALELEFR